MTFLGTHSPPIWRAIFFAQNKFGSFELIRNFTPSTNIHMQHDIKRVAANFLGQAVFGTTGKLGTLASIDVDGHCAIEYPDGTTDVTHYENIPTVANALACDENEIGVMSLFMNEFIGEPYVAPGWQGDVVTPPSKIYTVATSLGLDRLSVKDGIVTDARPHSATIVITDKLSASISKFRDACDSFRLEWTKLHFERQQREQIKESIGVWAWSVTAYIVAFVTAFVLYA